jgi:hypothetical protein
MEARPVNRYRAAKLEAIGEVHKDGRPFLEHGVELVQAMTRNAGGHTVKSRLVSNGWGAGWDPRELIRTPRVRHVEPIELARAGR